MRTQKDESGPFQPIDPLVCCEVAFKKAVVGLHIKGLSARTPPPLTPTGATPIPSPSPKTTLKSPPFRSECRATQVLRLPNNRRGLPL